MSKSQKQRTSYLRRLIYLLATVLTGSGAGGWAFPDLPVLGPAVKSAIQQFLAQIEGSTSNTFYAQGAPGSPTPAYTSPAVAADPRVAAYPASVQSGAPAASPSRNTIVIGSFNIQVFGTSKLQKQGIPEILVAVTRGFDLLAIQEIRTQDEHFLDQFVRMVNAQGAQYAYVIGPRLGRSSSKEQYAFLFDTTRIEVRGPSVTTMNDANDRLHREPLVAQFRTRGVPPAEAFSFWLVNIHTDPDEVSTELDALAQAFQIMQQQGDDDVIMLGDLNASERQLRTLGQLPGMHCAIAGIPTNTRGTKTYDNLLFDARHTVEYTGQSGVCNLMTTFGLTQEQALEVSDHFPVWAVFSLYEGGGPQVATRPLQPR